MKKIIILVAVLIQSQAILFAQDVDIDKQTGMVQVEGKDAFYLTPKNKQFMESDYSLENLQHKELAYLKLTKNGSTVSFYMVFTNSGNQCSLPGGTFNNTKHLAKKIAAANLVQNNVVSDIEERKFIILNGGTFVKDQGPAPVPERVIVVNDNNRQTASRTADISVKENKIYNNSEMAGTFKRNTENGTTTIAVYNMNDAMVCKATHADGNDNADWNLLLDGKTVTLLYNAQTPAEKLFKYLAEKGYL